MNPATQDLARRLIALETAGDVNSHEGCVEVVRVCEKLRISLARFFGLDGYRSLLMRALAMAKAERPALEPVQVQSNGSLDGLHPEDADAAFVVLVHLLGLLVEFVGEQMTHRLVLDGRPNPTLDESDASVEEQS